VTVITAEDIAAQGIQSVADVLRKVPGVDVVRTGSMGGTTSVFTRGGESNYTLILIDGVEVNLGGGDIDLANVTVDNIDRIEVIRGPASTLYGSGAVSGVIHIITRRGQGPPRGASASRAAVLPLPTDGAGRVLFHNQFQTSRDTTLGLQGERRLLPWWHSRLQLGYHRLKTRSHSEFGTPPDDTMISLFVLEESRLSVDWQSDFTLANIGNLTVGIVYETEEELQNNEHRSTTAGYLQQQLTLFESLVVIAGFRVDGNSAFGTHVTYQASAAYPFPTRTKLRAAVGTGFKEPTFFENFANSPFAVGNPNLNPERSFSWEVGIEQGL
jgi:outer membrane cobalamin receptor